MTVFDAIHDNKVAKLTIFCFQWMGRVALEVLAGSILQVLYDFIWVVGTDFFQQLILKSVTFRKTLTHYNNVTMSTMASGIIIFYLTVCSGAYQRKTSKLRVTGLCGGNPPVTGGFSSRMGSNTENVSIWCRHHENFKISAYLLRQWMASQTFPNILPLALQIVANQSIVIL